MVSKFKFIKSATEYQTLMDYLANEIRTCQALPNSKLLQDYYIKLINDRDELINHSINWGLSSKDHGRM